MSIVLFGGTGTLGHALAKIIDSQGDRCTVVSRCELRQKEMAKLYPKFNYVLGDVTDTTWSWDSAIKDRPKYVFNLAASKHVDICESNVQHCMRVNLDGTMNTYRWSDHIGANYVFSSTDKAVLPVNAYGTAKAMAERWLISQGKASIYRWGNILGSRGSVVPIIKDCIQHNKTFTLTHASMTRFWANIDDVANFMWEHKGLVTTKEPHIPPMKAASMLQLLKVMGCKNWQLGQIRPGEKIHEVLRSGHDFCLNSETCEHYTDAELKELVERS